MFTSSIFMSGRNFSMRVSMTALFVAVLETLIHFVATLGNIGMRMSQKQKAQHNRAQDLGAGLTYFGH